MVFIIALLFVGGWRLELSWSLVPSYVEICTYPEGQLTPTFSGPSTDECYAGWRAEAMMVMGFGSISCCLPLHIHSPAPTVQLLTDPLPCLQRADVIQGPSPGLTGGAKVACRSVVLRMLCGMPSLDWSPAIPEMAQGRVGKPRDGCLSGNGPWLAWIMARSLVSRRRAKVVGTWISRLPFARF